MRTFCPVWTHWPAMNKKMKIDLHMHTRVSDGTETPEELLQTVRAAGISLFAVTDHDAVKGNRIILDLLGQEDPDFLCGVELSCQDEQGKYHILGYGFDPDGADILTVVEKSRMFRMDKLQKRIQLLEELFHISFPENEIERLKKEENPGKPHLANLMVRYGYAGSLQEAFSHTLQQLPEQQDYIRPEEAVQGILRSGGFPVLAHPFFGDGSEHITDDAMEKRLDRLTAFGLKGVEAFYSGFTKEMTGRMLEMAGQRGLYVTAGSDYHGKNKMVSPGKTGLAEEQDLPESMKRFLRDIRKLPGWSGTGRQI